MPKVGFAEQSKAARTQRAIVYICERVVNRMRPAPSYAEVVEIDHVARTCRVRYAVDADPVTVAMGSIMPSRPGQVVRIEGVTGDRYIVDVLGESVIAGGKLVGEIFEWPGITSPPWALPADGRLLSTTDYPVLFHEYGYRHGGAGSQFAVPSRTSANQNVITLVRVL